LAPSSPSLSPPPTPDHLKNNHIPLPLHPLFSGANTELSAEDFLLPKAFTLSSVKPALRLVKALSSPLDWISEIIYISRPLVYASLLAADRRTNRHLVTTLMMEVISRYLRRRPPPSASLERAEYGRRDRDMFWYLLRGAIWQSFTRPRLEGVVDQTMNVPLLGLVSALVKDWIPLIDEYYYYTAP
jgi:peroxin-16